MHVFLSKRIEGIIGRMVFRAVRRFPWLYAAFTVAGISLGIVCFYYDVKEQKEWTHYIISIVWIFINTVWLLTWVRKMRTNSWTDLCDRIIDNFE